jgi:hypothetical protein
MSAFKIFAEILEMLFGVGCIVAGVMIGVEDPWLYLLGAGLIAWAVWNISREVRDSRKDSDVAAMAAERERIQRGG